MRTRIIYAIFILLTVCLAANAAVFENTPAYNGRAVFTTHCIKCHGADGTRGRFGAKDLQKSKLSDTELINVITNGKRVMPSWKKKLNQAEITAVKDYIKTLRN